MSAAYTAYNPNRQPAPAPPQGRPESFVSDISVDDEGPDTVQRDSDTSGRAYIPSLSSERQYYAQPRPESPSAEELYRATARDVNQKYNGVSPSQASETGDATLSDIADAYRNHAMLSGGAAGAGRRTPKAYERGEVTSEVIEDLQQEIGTLRTLLEQEHVRREEMTKQFKEWKDIITHNTKALIKNSQVNLHKNHMRIHPMLNDEGEYPDMVVFPTTVGTLMKMNEAHLTRLVVFYGLQSPSPTDYYAKYCALRDHLGIEP